MSSVIVFRFVCRLCTHSQSI